jgi:hypothetical protein
MSGAAPPPSRVRRLRFVRMLRRTLLEATPVMDSADERIVGSGGSGDLSSHPEGAVS